VEATVVVIAAVLIGLVLGASGSWLLRARELEGWREKAESQGKLATRLTTELAAAEKQIGALTAVRDGMVTEFKLLATQSLREQGEIFSRQNKEQIEGVLAPLREKIAEFHAGLRSVHTESIRERAALGEQIKMLTETGMKMSQETENLTRALKGNSRTQGAWGEMILATILERSGLRKGHEYVIQQTHLVDDGERLRPDVIVNLPLEHCIVIDSKVSLLSFERYVNAVSEDEKAIHLEQHLAAMRAQIEKLAKKEYWRVEGSQVDYAIMFVPIEAALAAAIDYDHELSTFALARGVGIATPNTLMIILRTVTNLWRIERQNKNAEAIADRAGKLHDKFVNFLEDMRGIGTKLDAANECYVAAMKKLSDGQGNLIWQVDRLKDLGASARKSLPEDLLCDELADLATAGEDSPMRMPEEAKITPMVNRELQSDVPLGVATNGA
jgi:DNA recombination protein RmuC